MHELESLLQKKERDGRRRAVFLRWRIAVLVFDVLVKGEGWIRDDTKVTMAPSTVEPSMGKGKLQVDLMGDLGSSR